MGGEAKIYQVNQTQSSTIVSPCCRSSYPQCWWQETRGQVEHSGQVSHLKTGQTEALCHSQRWVLQQYSNISLDEEAFNANMQSNFW